MRNIILTLALLILAACGTDETSEQHLAKAKDYITKSEYPSAKIELQNTLKLDGSSAEARWLLGKIYLDTGDILAAEKELQRAQDLGWTADDVRPALAKTALAQGKFADVLKLDYQDLGAAGASGLLVSQAFAQLAQGQTDRARELVTLALDKEPQSLDAKLAEALIFMQQGNMTGALAVIDAVLAVAPENGRAWRLKAQALLSLQKFDDARAAFDQSIAHSDAVFTDRAARALINLQLQDYAAAQAEVSELLELSPSDPTVNYIQGLLHVQNKKYRDAIKALTLAEPVARQYPLTLYYLGLAYLIEKDVNSAARFASQFVALNPDYLAGRKLYASTLVLQNKVKEAQNVLQSVLDSNPDDVGTLNIMANALLLDDQADKGMMLYARIAQLNPEWHILPLRLEADMVAASLGGEAGQSPAPAPDSDANFPQPDILLILNLLGKKDFAGAIEAAKSYQFRDLESLAPYYVLGRVYLAAGQPEDARKVFEQVLKRKPGDPSASLNLAQMALEAKDTGAARRYYRTVLDRDPDNLATLLQLAAIEAREKNAEAMVARLEQASKAHPTALEPRLRLAGYYLDTGSPDKVTPLFASLDELQRRSPSVLELTGLAQLAQQENASALATLQQLVNAKPGSARNHFLLAMAAGKTGDEQKTRQELNEALRLDANHIPALFALSRLALRDGEKAQFEQYLATLVKLAPDSTDVLRLQALSEAQNGNVAAALVLAQRVFRQAPATQTILELTGYQRAAGNAGDARVALQQWIKDHPNDVAVRLALANDLELGSNPPGAQVQYLAVLELEPDNISALNNLAWSLRLENPKKALEYVQRAARLAPDMPAVLDTLAVVEYHSGDHQGARQAIQGALAGAPDNPSMRYHQAMIDAALGENDKAVALLQALLAKDAGGFPERAEAEKLLKSLEGQVH
jgi:cellulose synthase operon protein C